MSERIVIPVEYLPHPDMFRVAMTDESRHSLMGLHYVEDKWVTADGFAMVIRED